MGDRIALLFDGRLRQLGGPSDFYRRPVDVQTARFFGGVNFIPATRHGDRVATPLGDFLAPEGCGITGACLATARPEALRLTPGAQGRITSALYLGTAARFKVQVNGLEIVVEDEAAASERFRVGDSVGIHIPADKLWLLPAE